MHHMKAVLLVEAEAPILQETQIVFTKKVFHCKKEMLIFFKVFEEQRQAFEADRLRQETALRDLQGQYALLERKYAARESRPEDLEKIADLESENNQRAEDLARMKKEMAYFKNELLNREENFNKKFGASPNVGVMNVLPQKKKKAIPRGF